ncbi:MAG: HAMP domain-containing sensor histidine kinase, partial [Mucilaginibacter sp.]
SSERKTIVNFSKLIDNIASSIRNLLKKENVEINTNFTAVEEINTISSYMYSIFYNLILNSIKYRQQGLAPVIEIKTEQCEDGIIITFKDNGMGIDLDKNGEHVFGLYKRFHRDIEGKGVGLFMVKTQVESLGGKITINSAINKGTEFKIRLYL